MTTNTVSQSLDAYWKLHLVELCRLSPGSCSNARGCSRSQEEESWLQKPACTGEAMRGERGGVYAQPEQF